MEHLAKESLSTDATKFPDNVLRKHWNNTEKSLFTPERVTDVITTFSKEDVPPAAAKDGIEFEKALRFLARVVSKLREEAATDENRVDGSVMPLVYAPPTQANFGLESPVPYFAHLHDMVSSDSIPAAEEKRVVDMLRTHAFVQGFVGEPSAFLKGPFVYAMSGLHAGAAVKYVEEGAGTDRSEFVKTWSQSQARAREEFSRIQRKFSKNMLSFGDGLSGVDEKKQKLQKTLALTMNVMDAAKDSLVTALNLVSIASRMLGCQIVSVLEDTTWDGPEATTLVQGLIHDMKQANAAFQHIEDARSVFDPVADGMYKHAESMSDAARMPHTHIRNRQQLEFLRASLMFTGDVGVAVLGEDWTQERPSEEKLFQVFKRIAAIASEVDGSVFAETQMFHPSLHSFVLDKGGSHVWIPVSAEATCLYELCFFMARIIPQLATGNPGIVRGDGDSESPDKTTQFSRTFRAFQNLRELLLGNRGLDNRPTERAYGNWLTDTGDIDDVAAWCALNPGTPEWESFSSVLHAPADLMQVWLNIAGSVLQLLMETFGEKTVDPYVLWGDPDIDRKKTASALAFMMRFSRSTPETFRTFDRSVLMGAPKTAGTYAFEVVSILQLATKEFDDASTCGCFGTDKASSCIVSVFLFLQRAVNKAYEDDTAYAECFSEAWTKTGVKINAIQAASNRANACGVSINILKRATDGHSFAYDSGLDVTPEAKEHIKTLQTSLQNISEFLQTFSPVYSMTTSVQEMFRKALSSPDTREQSKAFERRILDLTRYAIMGDNFPFKEESRDGLSLSVKSANDALNGELEMNVRNGRNGLSKDLAVMAIDSGIGENGESDWPPLVCSNISGGEFRNVFMVLNAVRDIVGLSNNVAKTRVAGREGVTKLDADSIRSVKALTTFVVVFLLNQQRKSKKPLTLLVDDREIKVSLALENKSVEAAMDTALKLTITLWRSVVEKDTSGVPFALLDGGNGVPLVLRVVQRATIVALAMLGSRRDALDHESEKKRQKDDDLLAIENIDVRATAGLIWDAAYEVAEAGFTAIAHVFFGVAKKRAAAAGDVESGKGEEVDVDVSGFLDGDPHAHSGDAPVEPEIVPIVPLPPSDTSAGLWG